ncbi:MAG TPA: DoxX family protein [Lacipirellulaceae bacterium]
MADYRRQLGVGAVFALVLLRLAIGWHFFREGIAKLAYDDGQRQFHVAFSAESFLSQAKGPLADRFHVWAPSGHDWSKRLAVRHEDRAPTSDETADRAKWFADYEKRHADAGAKGEPAPVEFPPFAPYHDWAIRIAEDWRAIVANVSSIAGLTDEQRQRAAQILKDRQQQLSDYLASQSDAIADYQHELWRLGDWRAMPEAANVPYLQKRIASKATETTAIATPWLNQVRDFEQKFIGDLHELLTPAQRSQAITTQSLEDALISSEQKQLERLNVGVTILTIAVGACLLVGFFTRSASLAGALFLLAVVATQPPWIADAAPIYNQIVELAGLLVLGGTRAGRWFGLDYITYSLFHRHRDIDN